MLGLRFATMEAKKVTVTDAVLIVKSREFASHLGICDGDFMCSNGWFSHFKQRRGIASRKLHGEASSVDPVAVQPGRDDLKSLLSEYRPCNVYNVDETELFLRMPPSKCLTTGPKHGTKQFKDHVTIVLCCNADGLDFVIGVPSLDASTTSLRVPM